jgi:hypothetical protein
MNKSMEIRVGSDSSPVLMKTNTTVISNEECSTFFGSTSVTGDHLCTTGADGHGVCGVIIKLKLMILFIDHLTLRLR